MHINTISHKKTIIFLIFAAILSVALCKTYSRFELTRIFRSNGMPGNVADWVCLAEAESGRRSNSKSGRNSNGSYDYGLFQINSKYWCRGEATVSNDCNTSCTNFLNENLSDDISCAKKIHRRHGFGAWYGWRNKCQGKNLSQYISGC